MTSLWAPVVGFMVAIYGLSAQESLPLVDRLGDKLAHVVAYGLFGVLCLRAYHGGLGQPRLWPSILALSTAAVYGAFDEWHQSFVPGRDASLLDGLADLIGAGLALLLVTWLTRRHRRRGAAQLR